MRGITRGAELTDGTRLARRGRIAEYGGDRNRDSSRLGSLPLQDLWCDRVTGKTAVSCVFGDERDRYLIEIAISTVTRLVMTEAARVTGKFSSKLGGYQ